MFRAGTNKDNGPRPRILVVRLGSMGDVIHALPAVATLKHGFPGSEVSWIVHPRWLELLHGNPFIDRLIPFNRRNLASVAEAWRMLRARRYEFAVDLQGLIQSALIASIARADRIYGFHQAVVREKLAAAFYSTKVRPSGTHVVDQNLELVAAAGASTRLVRFPLPDGTAEGELPTGDFVLANPVAGWGSKQWPLVFYSAVAARLKAELGISLVVNGAASAARVLAGIGGAVVNISGIGGLVHATRRAAAVLGVDSGPMHLAAALGKPGVAVFGPTDPQRNGPYGTTFTVLRAPGTGVTYQRGTTPDASMRAISPDAVFEALRIRLAARDQAAGCITL